MSKEQIVEQPVEENNDKADSVTPEREHKMFINTLKKKFETAEFRTADKLVVPKGNSTGSLGLDINLQVPLYEGALIEIFSNSGAGKTTLVLSILAEGAKRGKRLLFLDQEQSLQSTLVESFPELRKEGVLEVITAPTGEDALRIAELWALQYPGSIIAIDSVDALIPSKIETNELGEAEVGSLAKLMSQGCRKLKAAVGKSKSTIIFINQIRSKIGAYGNPDVNSGGRALPFYADQRIELMDITNETRIKNDEGNQIGHVVRFKIAKNKIAPPFVKGQFPLLYGKGIDRHSELCDLAVDLGILETTGNYILVNNAKGEQVKKPRKTVVDMLASDKEFYDTTLAALKELYPETFNNE